MRVPGLGIVGWHCNYAILFRVLKYNPLPRIATTSAAIPITHSNGGNILPVAILYISSPCAKFIIYLHICYIHKLTKASGKAALMTNTQNSGTATGGMQMVVIAGKERNPWYGYQKSKNIWPESQHVMCKSNRNCRGEAQRGRTKPSLSITSRWEVDHQKLIHTCLQDPSLGHGSRVSGLHPTNLWLPS